MASKKIHFLRKSTIMAFLIFMICFSILYYHVIAKMIQVWLNNDNYSYGFFIPFLSGYLIWRQRDKLLHISFFPSKVGLVLLILSLSFFVVANIGAEQFTMRFSMILVLYAMVVYLMDWQAFQILFFPISYLIFMIPLPAIIWNGLALSLKLFATQIAVSVISLLNIPVYHEGNIIYLSNINFEVIDACSGLRSLTAMLSLSTFVAMITKTSKINKIIIFFSAVPVAIVLNVIRLVATALLARYFGPKTAHGFFHEVSGMLVFILAMAIIGGITRVVKDHGGKVELI